MMLQLLPKIYTKYCAIFMAYLGIFPIFVQDCDHFADCAASDQLLLPLLSTMQHWNRLKKCVSKMHIARSPSDDLLVAGTTSAGKLDDMV